MTPQPRHLSAVHRPDQFAVDAETGCWNWLGLTNRTGYPHGYQHRRAWESVNGPRPAGWDVHHVCKNTSCVNPAHLEAVDERVHDIEHFLHERAGITIEDVERVRERGRKFGVRAEDVAAEFGISTDAVRRYWRASRWSEFISKGKVEPEDRPPCGWCGCDMAGHRRDARFCTQRCRSAFAQRRRRQERKAA